MFLPLVWIPYLYDFVCVCMCMCLFYFIVCVCGVNILIIYGFCSNLYRLMEFLKNMHQSMGGAEL